MNEIVTKPALCLMEYFRSTWRSSTRRSRSGHGGRSQSETLIRELIGRQFPSHDVLGEEEGLVDTAATIAGTWIRWMEPPISRTASRYFAFRWRWSSKENASPGRLRSPRDEMFARTGKWGLPQPAAHSCFQDGELAECLVATASEP